MKKLISIFLTAAMLLTLAACGNTAAEAASDDAQAEAVSTDTSAQTPPEFPDGEAPAMADGETPPEKPDGTPSDGANGQPGTPPDGNPPDGAPGGQPGGFGGSGEVTQGTSANTISEDTAVTGTTYTSTGDDENALRVSGAAVTLDSITVNKSAGATSNTEDGNFYGMNATLLATDSATVTIKNATVTSSAQNGNGVFSYGSGTYTSNGYNSPAVYSTAAITVQNTKLTANNSEALVIEGKNSIALTNCTVSGNMSSTKGSSSSENVHTVMIYQSMSGDADVGTSEFSMTGGSLTGKNGDLFYITNTHCILMLSGVTLKNEDASGYLLRVVGNSASHDWDTAGSNGAQVEFTADSQTLTGNILVDTISTLNLTLQNGSSFTGTIHIAENAEGGAAVTDNAVVTIESGCTWNLTGDCTITSLTNNGKAIRRQVDTSKSNAQKEPHECAAG